MLDLDETHDVAQEAHNILHRKMKELTDEVVRLRKENEKLQLLSLRDTDVREVLSAAMDWYQDPQTESAWSRPCGTDRKLRAVIEKALQ